MDGVIRILRKFVVATILVSVLLLLFNFIMLGSWYSRKCIKGLLRRPLYSRLLKDLRGERKIYFRCPIGESPETGSSMGYAAG